jgi:thioredoxin-like negative regulator of GroEL
MKSHDLPPQLIHLLADIFELGCTNGCHQETVTVLKLLKHVRPDASPLALVEAWNLIEMRRLAAARELLDAAESAHPADPMTKAMLVMCLYLQGDSLWQAYASEVRQLPDNEEAVAVVTAIEEVASDVPVGRQARQYA